MPAGRAQEDFTGKEAQAGRGAGRSKTVGAWETEEGEQVPPPRQPLPQWRYPPRSSARLPASYTPGHCHCPRRPARWGMPAEGYGYPCEGTGGVGGRQGARCLERGRQGRGNEFPLPVSPSPRGDIHTVQHMGRFWRETGHGGPPTPPRIRLPTKYRHARTPSPGGGGGGAPKARVGWGVPAEAYA